MTPGIRWAVLWNGCFQWGGWQWGGTGPSPSPLLFHARREARAYIEERWGYIRNRADLRGAPFHWRMPKAVRVRVILEEVNP